MKEAPVNLWHYEQTLWAEGVTTVAGVDEAGRGPLAGSVVAAAVILPADFDATDIADSKTLSETTRECLYTRITEGAVTWGIGEASPREIDRLNILRATHTAMRRALAALHVTPDAVLVDGLPVPDLHARCTAIVKGDSLSVSIAAASILAKVTRDRQMALADELYPVYGFGKHKGYAAATHLEAIQKHGACPIHRLSFRPFSQQVLHFEDEPTSAG